MIYISRLFLVALTFISFFSWGQEIYDPDKPPEEYQLFAPPSFSLTCNRGRFFENNEVIVRYRQFDGPLDKWESLLSYRGMLDNDFISNGGIFNYLLWKEKDDDFHYFGEKIGPDWHVKINRETLDIKIKQPPRLGKLRTSLKCKFIDDDKAIKRQQDLWKKWEEVLNLEKERIKSKNKI